MIDAKGLTKKSVDREPPEVEVQSLYGGAYLEREHPFQFWQLGDPTEDARQPVNLLKRVRLESRLV